MTINLPGYSLTECLYEGVDTVIYRARRESDFSTVIVKTIKAEYPSLEEITRLRHEYKLLQQLAGIKGIVKVYDLEQDHNNVALILEDFWGFSFRQLTKINKIPALSFLPLAIQLTETLHEIHQKNIIHKDLNPQNILLDPEKWTVKLIDFSIASRLSKETPAISNPDFLEGTLGYISPEQTGRMNRSVDYRTDFYSLGVTFYEMLTGQLPFLTTDSLELVHCHIAKKPTPPHQICPEVPQAVSDIIMKLMEKTAEERYQSALGLKADLEICLKHLKSGEKLENFTPGLWDQSSQLLIQQKLYGREKEVQLILEAFDRVSTGTSELVMVSGYSGVGKTSVIQEVYKPISRQKGYFVSGKFNQFEKNIPYAALIQAFQELMITFLTENEAEIAVWKEKILEQLGENGQVIIDVIPEVEYIIGSQPAVPELPSSQAQNRFNRVFQQFIAAIAKPQHPLVLFLDDLQWADGASLQLIETLMLAPDCNHLLLIGAYRDNEISPTHPTIVTIDHLKSKKIILHEIVLQPLQFCHVEALIKDAFGTTITLSNAAEDRIQPFVELVYNKTQGSPFFITHLLETLYGERLIYFDVKSGQWLWDLKQIQAIGISDYSVVELVIRTIQKLPKLTQEILILAACIGHQFSLETLAIICEQSQINAADVLWPALQAGLILPLSQAYKIPLVVEDFEQVYGETEESQITYKFLHDRVQQAAYSLIPDDQKKKIHIQIGRLLLQNITSGLDSVDLESIFASNLLHLTALEHLIFDIVNQLNIGVDLITEPQEKQNLAFLNLVAGRKAKASVANEAATQYLNVGLNLLTESSWLDSYQNTLDLYQEAVEAEYHSTNYERAEQLANIVLDRAKNTLDKVKVYEIKIQFYIAQNQMLDAIDTAIEVLDLLGVSLSKKPQKLNIIANSLLTKVAVTSKGIENLAQLPEMTDPYKIAAMRVLVAALVPAFVASPNLFPLITFKIVNLSLRYGISPQAAYGYGLYGWLLCGALDDINSGYEFGQLSIQLFDRFNSLELNCKALNIYNAFIRHWKEHGRQTIPVFIDALKLSLETGNIEYAGYSSINYCHYTFLVGEELETLRTAHKPYVDLMKQVKQDYALHSVSTVRQTVLNLLGESDDPCCLVGESFNEVKMLPIFQKANVMTSLFMTYCYKTMLLYLFKDYRNSVKAGELTDQYTASCFGFMSIAAHNFYYSLALLGNCYQNKSSQKIALNQVEINQKKMKNWATHAPENYRHKFDLIEAEKARLLGFDSKAIDLYRQAVEGAKQSGYIQEEALANELTAQFYFSRNQEAIAEVYLLQAYYGYIHWGAKAKVKDLESNYPEFFGRILHREDLEIDVTQIDITCKTTTQSVALDVAAVAKAMQVISSETNFNRLLSKLMHIAIENAGASKGLLFLFQEDTLQLVAEGSVGTEVKLLSFPAKNGGNQWPVSLLYYVERTQKTVILNQATREGIFTKDPYIQATQPQSIFCWPLIHQGEFTGILYLENHWVSGAFTAQRLEVLKLLASQASISLVEVPSLSV